MSLKLLATGLLTKYGKVGHVKIERKNGAVFDPVSGDFIGGSVDNINLVGVTTTVDKALMTDDRVTADSKMLIVDSQVEPLMSDIYIIGSEKLAPIMISPVMLNFSPIIYKIVLNG